MTRLAPLLLLLLATTVASAQQRDTVRLWPRVVPGEPAPRRPPVEVRSEEERLTRMTEVSDPAIVVYPAPAGRANGAGVVVLPGGGYNILAIDKEGYEVAEWLNGLGYAAFVLQYRVPRKQEGALQDVQRALRLVRGRAGEWGLDPARLGVLGFSAGGSLGARASTRFDDVTYPAVDDADRLSARPDFAVLIYPAYLDQGTDRRLTPELRVDARTPPTFLFGTADDRVGNSVLVMAGALRDAGVPVEAHLLPTGGHGYGLRPGNPAAESWPRLAEAWLRGLHTARP